MGLDSAVTARLEQQRGVVAVWQLVDDGCSEDTIRHAAKQLRRVHDGVYLSGHAPLTDWQRWKAATISAPGTVLSDWSGSVFLGIRDKDRWPTTVKRLGSGGPKTFGPRPDRLGSLKVFHTDRLAADTIEVDEIRSLSPGRTVLDLINRSSEEGSARLVREVLRRNVAEPIDLRVQVARHEGRRGVAKLQRLVDEYGPLDLGRSKSDAEALAVVFLTAAGVEAPLVNVIIAGAEGDLFWVNRRLILELDGPQYHQFPMLDARKQATWEKAGCVVRRLPTDDVYDRQHLLLSAASSPVTEAERAIAASTTGAADVLARYNAGNRFWTGEAPDR